MLYVLKGHDPVPVEDPLRWARWFEKGDRRVALTKVGELSVSTVFLGIDHNYTRRGKPILFETMVFQPSTGEYAGSFPWRFPRPGREESIGLTRRYSTWDEAETGHALTVALVEAMVGSTTKEVRE